MSRGRNSREGRPGANTMKNSFIVLFDAGLTLFFTSVFASEMILISSPVFSILYVIVH